MQWYRGVGDIGHYFVMLGVCEVVVHLRTVLKHVLGNIIHTIAGEQPV